MLVNLFSTEKITCCCCGGTWYIAGYEAGCEGVDGTVGCGLELWT